MNLPRLNPNNPNDPRQFVKDVLLTLAIIALVLALGGAMILVAFWVVIWR